MGVSGRQCPGDLLLFATKTFLARMASTTRGIHAAGNPPCNWHHAKLRSTIQNRTSSALVLERRMGFWEGREALTRILLLPNMGHLLACCSPSSLWSNKRKRRTTFDSLSPEQQKYVFQMGRDLGQLMAMRLVEIVTELMQSVLQHLAKGLVDDSKCPFDLEVLGPSNVQAARCLYSERNGHLLCLNLSCLDSGSGSIDPLLYPTTHFWPGWHPPPEASMQESRSWHQAMFRSKLPGQASGYVALELSLRRADKAF